MSACGEVGGGGGRVHMYLGGADGKESAGNARVPSSVPGLERFPGGENGNPLQYSCLGNPMDRGTWQAI